jgi:hypothetical protein
MLVIPFLRGLTRTLGIPWWKRCGICTLADRRGIRLLSVNSYIEETESLKYPFLTTWDTSPSRAVLKVFKLLSYGPPWVHYLGGYQDRLLSEPLGLPDLCRTVAVGVRRKDHGGEVLG